MWCCLNDREENVMSADYVMTNLKSLVTDMRAKDWSISSFKFSYKQRKYVVLVRRFTRHFHKPKSERYKYVIAKLDFCDMNNENHRLGVYADNYKLILKPKTLREFFGIDWAQNLGDILHQFYERLNKNIPRFCKFPEEDEKSYVLSSLSKSDSEDPRKIYFSYLMRNRKDENGRQHYRTEFNTDKARFLLQNDDADLLEKTLADDTISFCFEMDESKQTSLIVAWAKFEK